MPWRFFGKALADPSASTAAGFCDRCDTVWQLSQLKWEMQWRGTSVQRTGFRVCPRCLDIPAPFLKAFVIPADPYPVPNPRTGYVEQEMNNSSPALSWDQLNTRWDDGISVWDPS